MSPDPLHPEIREFLNEMRGELKDVTVALKGNKDYGQRGLFERVDTVEKAVENHDRKLWKLGVILALAGGIGATAKDAIVNLFTH